MLVDGTYDAFVIDVDDEGAATAGGVRLELTITSGAHKGEVVAVRGDVGSGSALDLLGMPVTLVVEAGVPRVQPG